LAGFDVVSTHTPLHAVCPDVHAHVPPLQTWLPVHACAHAPQLPGSLSGSTHAPLHATNPAAHTHVSVRHVSPVPHTLPHEPQSSGLLRVCTHAPLQMSSRNPQFAVQKP
jgi:hypothetical protein